MKAFKLVMFSFFVLLLYLNAASAKPIYRWEAPDGTVHFSSKPMEKAEPAKLPPISRGEVKLTTRPLVSCGKHGGINCQAGPDKDGSVICYDGYKGATTRYRFSCNSPKLQISEISDTREGRFSVFVRNSNSVDAAKPAVFFTPPMGRKVKLEGPEQIEAFGLAEFKYQSTPEEPLVGKATLAQLDVTCANCP